MAINQIISKFNDTAAERDFSRNNLYRLVSLKTRALALDEKDLLYCKGANLPSRENPSATLKYHGMQFHYPASTVKYDGGSYQLTFYVDMKGEIRDKFETASRLIFDNETNQGNWRFPQSSDTIVLAQLDFKMDTIKYITLYGVCLNKIDQIQTQFADGDGSAIEVTVTFTYNYYRTSEQNK